ncbi:MAG: EAL domain-containing protein [Actinomycetota bacterium]|nr:EAL domain-containing protein [Actinomycetota bacterium]
MTTRASERGDAPPGAPPSPGYGPGAAALLSRAVPFVEPHVQQIVEDFYSEISSMPDPAAVLDRLTPPEFRHLKSSQGAHLRALLDPTLSREDTLGRARRAGALHAMVAVEPDWYSAAVGHYLAGIVRATRDWSTPEERLELHHVVSSRLVTDLEGVLQGYRDVEGGEADTLAEVSRVAAGAETVPDLARGTLDALIRLAGVTAGFFGRPDRDGVLQFEAGVGAGIETFMSDDGSLAAPLVSTRPTDPTGLGPSGRACRTGRVERSDTYLLDPTTAPWHDLALVNGWRSSAAVPLAGPDGALLAVVSLYSSFPGYFAYSSRSALLDQVKSVVETTLAHLERRPGATGVVSYAARATHLAELEAGSVVMMFQPIVDLASGRVAKLEALARLGRPGSLASPAEFLPAFGETELLRLFEIGLDQALGELRSWERLGLATEVSINLPATSGTDARYVALVESALRHHGVAGSRLTLELLETGAIDGDPGAHARSITAIRALGVRLSEDDLGSGYSSLLRLRDVAFDEAKIDQEFVRGAARSPRDALHFIQPLTSLAHALGIRVTVEGLESDGLVEAATFLGADAGQGYAIARPLPTDEVVPFARSFRLDVDRELPRTTLGALAAHLAWENHLAVLAARADGLGRADRLSCPFDAHLTSLGSSPETGAIGSAHRRLHAATAGGLGSAPHLAAWKRLERLVASIGSADRAAEDG